MKPDAASFLADSLALWQVDGTVEGGASAAVTMIRAGACNVWIEQNADTEKPWRWLVRWRDAEMLHERSRPCASVTGMLNAVRRALNVERGDAVKVVAAAAKG